MTESDEMPAEICAGMLDNGATYWTTHDLSLVAPHALGKSPTRYVKRDLPAMAFEKWLTDRTAWLRREMLNGGNYIHLNARVEECEYVIDKFRAFMRGAE